MVRLLIVQPFTLGTPQQFVGPLAIGNLAGVVPKIEFGKISGQMGFAYGMERAHNSTFEKGEVALDTVCVPERATHVFLGAVIDRAVSGKFIADFRIDRAFVRHKVLLVAGALDDDRVQGLFVT